MNESMGIFKYFIAIACLLLPVTLAFEQLCIGVDNELEELYIDGADVTSQLKSRVGKPGRHCDCLKIPPDSGVVAIKATARSDFFGIQWCETENRVLYNGWKCKSRSRLLEGKKQNKPSSGSTKWMMTSYDDSWWKVAKSYQRQQHCKRYYKLPCQTIGYYWTQKPVINQPVYCRLKVCAENCKACATAGPGKCDPGQCTYGEGVNAVTQATMCQRKCWLEIKAVGTTGSVSAGYIKVTDFTSKSTTQWITKDPGRYAAIIDMTSCDLLQQTYQPWSGDADQTSTVNQWRNNVANLGLLAVDIAVGSGTTGEGRPGYAPWIDIWLLGSSAATPLLEIDNSANPPFTTYSTCITGVPQGSQTFTPSCS